MNSFRTVLSHTDAEKAGGVLEQLISHPAFLQEIVASESKSRICFSVLFKGFLFYKYSTVNKT